MENDIKLPLTDEEFSRLVRSLPTVDKLPADWYDPEEDAIWEEQYKILVKKDGENNAPD